MSGQPASGGWVLRVVGIAVIALLLVAGSTLLGPVELRWDEIWQPDSQGGLNVFWNLRVPRVALAAVAGAGLALGGVILQALFRNPLASPYTLGIASGASLAAAVGFLLHIGGRVAGVPTLSLLAFGGALAALGLVFLMARLRGGREMTRLLLAGVCVAYLCSAGVLLVTVLADRAVTNNVVMWMIGSLATVRPQAAVEVGLVLAAVLLLAVYWHRALDLIALSDELAATRGVAVGRVVWGSYLAVGVLTAVVVANCGPVGFVGLMVPHMARALVGGRTLPLVLASVSLGAAFLAVCDGLARSISIYEMPVGVLTSILGACFFFYLLARGGRTA